MGILWKKIVLSKANATLTPQTLATSLATILIRELKLWHLPQVLNEKFKKGHEKSR
jgi:hypothetical protein